MDKNQFDEALINAIYLLGGSNTTPFKDIIFFEEEKDINDKLYNKTIDVLERMSDDCYLDDYDDIMIDKIDDVDDLIENVKSKIDVDKIADDVMKRLSEKASTYELFPSDIPVIVLDPEVYKDLDVNKFDLTLGNFKKLTDSDLDDIENLKEEIEELNIDMLNTVRIQIKDKKVFARKHKEKYKKIEDLYDKICDRKTEEIENLMNDFCKYIISSKYCKNKPSVITLVASSTVCIRNYMIKCLDDIFKPIITKASKDTDTVLTLLDL